MNTQDKSIQAIIDKIIEGAGMSGMSEETEQQFRQNMEAEINRRIGIIVMDSLDDEGLKKYEELSDEDRQDEAKVQEIIQNHSKDLENKVKEGLENFMKEAISAANQS